ncbi:hypothetical protein GCM10008959_21930 [Deinococcus seoulensis]|uniref:Uncharacterized protein n=2 Tax=Deinococcus TaxID=1298 RepID=A0ABQ2RRY8_9DEIO|nr:hypothetical protein GCM10008959_21930 [Deinococcus seoulensis]GGS20665.1 hypothetical protein GCM10008961_10390 [Deinococcus knuensis]
MRDDGQGGLGAGGAGKGKCGKYGQFGLHKKVPSRHEGKRWAVATRGVWAAGHAPSAGMTRIRFFGVKSQPAIPGRHPR